jgi:opacity protein-like surface antigen
MKKLLYACTALVMALTTATALAADVSGTWTGAMNGGQGGFQLSFTLKQDGAKLTGTVQGPQGDPIAISEGKIDGDKISFKVVIQGGTTITHEGTINAAGDEIKLTSKSEGGQFPGGEMTLKKAKAPSPPAN